MEFCDKRNPHYADWQVGYRDGWRDDTKKLPESREGAALEAYKAGWLDGVENYYQYRDEQENQS